MNLFLFFGLHVSLDFGKRSNKNEQKQKTTKPNKKIRNVAKRKRKKEGKNTKI